MANTATDSLTTLRDEANIPWICLAVFLVFFMQAGFAMVEAGFTRAKNVCNIIRKNLMDISLGSIVLWIFGFGLIFGISSSWIGSGFFFFDAGSDAAKATGNSEGFNWAFLIFLTVFCATAVTIVSGAVAERAKFSAYLVYPLLSVDLSIPFSVSGVNPIGQPTDWCVCWFCLGLWSQLCDVLT